MKHDIHTRFKDIGYTEDFLGTISKVVGIGASLKDIGGTLYGLYKEFKYKDFVDDASKELTRFSIANKLDFNKIDLQELNNKYIEVCRKMIDNFIIIDTEDRNTAAIVKDEDNYDNTRLGLITSNYEFKKLAQEYPNLMKLVKITTIEIAHDCYLISLFSKGKKMSFLDIEKTLNKKSGKVNGLNRGLMEDAKYIGVLSITLDIILSIKI